MKQYKLYDLAKIIRSKNSGPFAITLDVLFDNGEVYHKIKEMNLITKELISKLYGLEEKSITDIVFYDPAWGFKVTYDRKISSGTCLDTDVYGAQQHGPLGSLIITM